MKGISLLFQERIYCFLCDKLSCAHILIGSHSWSIGGQMYWWRHHQNFFNYLLYKKNRFQVAVRLLCNRSQRTSKCGKTIVTHSDAPRVSLFCSGHILTSSMIYYWTDARQLGIYLLIRAAPVFLWILVFRVFCWVSEMSVFSYTWAEISNVFLVKMVTYL